MKAPLPRNERERLDALRRYEILDTGFEQTFDRLTELACYVCDTPIAAISLVDEQRQWFKAISGLPVRETPRDVAFCAHAILEPEAALIVEDATSDGRFFDNPLVTDAPGIRFYAGIPLVTPEGIPLGTLCVIDQKTRTLTEKQLEALRTLAEQTMGQLELRQSVRKTREYVDALRLAELVYNNSTDGMLVTDETNRIIAVNPAFTKLTGYEISDVEGKNPNILRSGRQDAAFYQSMWSALELTGQWHGELWNRRKNGEVYPEWLTINRVLDAEGRPHRYVALFSDITERKKMEEQIWRHANFDTLTQLPNRRLFMELLSLEIRKVRRENELLAVLFVDLDRFKEINDSFGHDVGDAVLVEAAHRIKTSLRLSDTVARLGGDEFTVILSDIEDPTCAELVVRKVLDSLAQPFRLDDSNQGYVTGSIGMAFFPDDASSPDVLINRADRAMYLAKSAGRNCFSRWRS